MLLLLPFLQDSGHRAISTNHCWFGACSRPTTACCIHLYHDGLLLSHGASHVHQYYQSQQSCQRTVVATLEVWLSVAVVIVIIVVVVGCCCYCGCGGVVVAVVLLLVSPETEAVVPDV